MAFGDTPSFWFVTSGVCPADISMHTHVNLSFRCPHFMPQTSAAVDQVVNCSELYSTVFMFLIYHKFFVFFRDMIMSDSSTCLKDFFVSYFSPYSRFTFKNIK